MNKLGKQTISIVQIMVLVFGIIAISYAIGSEIRVVSSEDERSGGTTPKPEKSKEKKATSKEPPAEPKIPGTPTVPGTTNLPFGTLLSATTFFPWKKMGKSCVEYIEGYDAQKVKTLLKAGAITQAKANQACKTFYKDPSTGKNIGASLLSAVTWAGVTYGLGRLLFPALGAGAGLTDSASLAAAGAVFSGYFVGSAITQASGSLAGGLVGTGVGIIVGAMIFAATYSEEAQKRKTFTNNPFGPPLGGDHCEECNDQIFGCSEYQCRSLGQACELENTATPGEEVCIWKNRWDSEPPTMTPLKEALINDNYKYEPFDAVFPEDIGVKIVYNQDKKGCIDAFTPLSFGITTDEEAQCKIDYIRKLNFTSLDFDFGGSSTFKYNHTQVMSLPGPSSLAAQNITLENGGEFELYAKCQDVNGNANPGNMVFKFCVDDGPDTTPPLIVTTDPLSGLPIAYNVTSLTAMIYVNEPAECKWSHLDKAYDQMENEMTCATKFEEFNAQTLWPCEAQLTGLKDNEENKYYFRCKDQPKGVPEEDRNTNVQSYPYILIGSKPLVIDSVEPEGTIEDSTDTVKVKLTAKTSAGFKDGEAICYYNDEAKDAETEYIQFFETNSHTHTQELMLPAGDYEYFVKCVDLAGNADYDSTTFTVYTDKEEPIVTRIYFEENFLKITTHEDAECVYDNTDCSYPFADGIKMQSTNKVDHFTNWNTNLNYYIKCKDSYGNEPMPNKCSVMAKPFETYYAQQS